MKAKSDSAPQIINCRHTFRHLEATKVEKYRFCQFSDFSPIFKCFPVEPPGPTARVFFTFRLLEVTEVEKYRFCHFLDFELFPQVSRMTPNSNRKDFFDTTIGFSISSYCFINHVRLLGVTEGEKY